VRHVSRDPVPDTAELLGELTTDLPCGSGDHRTGGDSGQQSPMIVEGADAGTPGPEMIRGYYGLVGGGAGFLILETDDLLEVNAWLQPSMHLMSWDVRAIIPFDYEEDLAEFRQMLAQGS
jgi:hypothetical protein